MKINLGPTPARKHMRRVSYLDLARGDAMPTSRCSQFGSDMCGDWSCPRHQPTAYSEVMARHATDSISPRWGGRHDSAV